MQVPEVTQTAQGQKDKLRAVLDKVSQQLQIQSWNETKWSVESEYPAAISFVFIGHIAFYQKSIS